jgi:hypothetical protein
MPMKSEDPHQIIIDPDYPKVTDLSRSGYTNLEGGALAA